MNTSITDLLGNYKAALLSYFKINLILSFVTVILVVIGLPSLCQTPLNSAITNRDAHTVKKLLDANNHLADKPVTNRGITGLMLASLYKEIPVVKNSRIFPEIK